MTREEKQLLLKDLCARLPYGVKCSCTWSHEAPNGTTGCIQELSTFLIDEIEIMDNPEYDCQICDVKPYLRSMSSMTEEEKADYHFYCETVWDSAEEIYYHYDTFKSIDWLNEHHFDYRRTPDGETLIESGLAIEAPEGMYKD